MKYCQAVIGGVGGLGRRHWRRPLEPVGVNMGIPLFTLVVLLIFVSGFFTESSTFALDPLLVIKDDTHSSSEIITGLTAELGGEFNLLEVKLKPRTTVADITAIINGIKPRAAILIDTSAIRLFKIYREQSVSRNARMPLIIVKGMISRKEFAQLRNTTGLFNEVPLVTSAVGLRKIIGNPIHRLGIVHRAYLKDFIEENRVYCSEERIGVKAYQLPEHSQDLVTDLKRALETLVKRDTASAIWVPNDPMMLSDDLIKTVWVPFVRKQKIPVIVGTEELVSGPFDFGMFAVRPDFIAYGQQAAQLVFKIRDNNWQTHSIVPELPISAYKIVNCVQVESFYAINTRSIRSVDEITCAVGEGRLGLGKPSRQ